MDVQRPEIARNVLLLIRAYVLEVLVVEDDDTALCKEQCEVVLLAVVQLRELQAADIGSDYCGELCCSEVRVLFFGEEVAVLLVSDETPVVVFEGLEGGQAGFGVVDGEVGRIWVLGGR